MTMLILTTHILISLALSAAMVAVFASAHRRKATKLYAAMMVSFAGVVTTGAALLIVSPAGLGRFCAMMTAFTLLTFAARAYYKHQVPATVTASN